MENWCKRDCITGHDVILKYWTESFENLYKNDGNYDNDFLAYKIRKRDRLLQYSDKNELNNMAMNSAISLDEVRQAVLKAKTNKAVGIDRISNEILKNDSVINALYKLFKGLFEEGQIPTLWRKSIIHPIPKTKTKLVRPELHRGLVLQSCIYKLYSSILNSRLTTYLETNQSLSDYLHFKGNIATQVKWEKVKFPLFIDFRKALWTDLCY